MKSHSILNVFNLIVSFAFVLLFVGLTACSDQVSSGNKDTSSSLVAKETGPNSGNSPNLMLVERTWVETGEEWEMIFPHDFLVHGEFNPSPKVSPSNDNAHTPLYTVAPFDPANPQGTSEVIGDHDHIVQSPQRNGGNFSGNWKVFFVIDPSKLPLEPPFTDDFAGGLNNMEDLQNALNNGSAILIDPGVVFFGTLRPLHTN